MDLDKTIAAIATASGSGLRSMIRVSGRQVGLDLGRALKFPSEHSWYAASKQLAPSIHSVSLDVRALDRQVEVEIALWPSNRSYTCQPMAEIHCIGSPPIVRSILRLLNENGIRLAKPGEFTLRAFLAGRIDLPQAGAVLGVIDARTSQEMQISLKQLAGGMSHGLLQTQNSLLNLLADVEAGLDFVDEDIEFISDAVLGTTLATAIKQIDATLEELESRETSQAEFRVVIFGQPNVGKSSLFNVLSGERVNVDRSAGTTRDYNSVSLKLPLRNGSFVKIQLIDTAGVRQQAGNANQHSVEYLAQLKTDEQILDSHFRIFCLDGSRELDVWEQEILARSDSNRLIVVNKVDLSANPKPVPIESSLEVSCRDQRGIAELKTELAVRIVSNIETVSGMAATTDQCLTSLRECKVALQNALESCQRKLGHELVAGDIREAVDDIGVVTGTVHSEDVLARIFGRFCIGK